PRRAEALALARAMGLGLGGAVFARQTRALAARPDAQPMLARARLPALVLCGRHDALCPVRRHELMAKLLPGARLEILEDAGHLPTIEAPEATNAALARWLEGAAPAPRAEHP
ncbi:MAG: alpha/beta hydrolase, partial [Rhodobacteraceae bacterium]|nr:alpha/beta hydrolase [Paracoccaceae bacterium]